MTLASFRMFVLFGMWTALVYVQFHKIFYGFHEHKHSLCGSLSIHSIISMEESTEINLNNFMHFTNWNNFMDLTRMFGKKVSCSEALLAVFSFFLVLSSRLKRQEQMLALWISTVDRVSEREKSCLPQLDNNQLVNVTAPKIPSSGKFFGWCVFIFKLNSDRVILFRLCSYLASFNCNLGLQVENRTGNFYNLRA